jgi:hypothetical protein
VQLLNLLLNVAPEHEELEEHALWQASKVELFNILILLLPTKAEFGTDIKLLLFELTKPIYSLYVSVYCVNSELN